MSERLLGVETEYAVSATDAYGGRVDLGRVVEHLMRTARQRLPHLPDEMARGIFTASGGRFYIDCGGHPEVTTPECSDPWAVVRHVRAGETMLRTLADTWSGPRARRRMTILRANVDHSGSHATWGMHENYGHRAAREVLRRQLVPHLVSRVVVTGAGGFDNVAGGLAFTLSPRTAHLGRESSTDSTGNRALVHEKNEDLCRGHHRLHLICGETLCSDLATWLRTGTTALVVALAEGGVRPGDTVALRDPLAAMRAFANDPTCRAAAEAVRGAPLTALAIQRHYLAAAEAHAGAAFMPSWTRAVCREWRAILDRLTAGWEAVATTLDWAIKLALFRDHVRRRGTTWEALQAWSPIVATLAQALERSGARMLLRTAVGLGNDGPIAAEIARHADEGRSRGLDWRGLDAVLALQGELYELDARFGELGPEGLFTRLDAAGVLAHHVAATGESPEVPRVRVRAELIDALSGAGNRYCCTWEGVWDCEQGTYVDLRDPFTTAPATWQPWDLDANGDDDAVPPERFFSGRASVVRRRRRRSAGDDSDPIALNNRALALRKRHHVEEAERLLRLAIAIEDTQVAADSPKRPHRRNNLALVLLAAGKLADADAANREAWALKLAPHDVTSARILFTRVALGLRTGDRAVGLYLGQLKTLLGAAPLPCVGDVSATWDVDDVLDTLMGELAADDDSLLIDLAAALNDPRRVATLATAARWTAAPPTRLDAPWPDAIDPPASAA